MVIVHQHISNSIVLQATIILVKKLNMKNNIKIIITLIIILIKTRGNHYNVSNNCSMDKETYNSLQMTQKHIVSVETAFLIKTHSWYAVNSVMNGIILNVLVLKNIKQKVMTIIYVQGVRV